MHSPDQLLMIRHGGLCITCIYASTAVSIGRERERDGRAREIERGGVNPCANLFSISWPPRAQLRRRHVVNIISENVRPTWNPKINVSTYLFAAVCGMCAISCAIQITINQCQLPTMSPSRVRSTVRLRVCLVFTGHICLVQLNCVAVGMDVAQRISLFWIITFGEIKYSTWHSTWH